MRSANGSEVRRLAKAVAPAPAADLTVDVDPQDLM